MEIEILASMPMSTLAAFIGGSLDQALDAITAAWQRQTTGTR